MAAPAPILLSFFPLKKPEIQKQKCLLEKKIIWPEEEEEDGGCLNFKFYSQLELIEFNLKEKASRLHLRHLRVDSFD